MKCIVDSCERNEYGKLKYCENHYRRLLRNGSLEPKRKSNKNLESWDYDRMLRKQEFICPICKLKPDKVMHVDHDHLTGAVRGLLCESCNKGLGFFKDSVENLRNAIKYLET